MTEQDPLFWLRGAGFLVGGALFWLLYFDWKDRLRPEPRRLLLLAFGLGLGSALLCLGLYRLATWLGAPADPGVSRREVLIYTLALVGPLEEGAKFLVARLFVFRWRHFDEPLDGLVYASAIAIGFAAAENVLYLPLFDWPHQLARALASPLTHSLFASIWGFGVGRAFFGAGGPLARFAWQASTLLAAMLLHGLYDWTLLDLGATYLASGIALVLWIFVIVQARRLARTKPLRSPEVR